MGGGGWEVRDSQASAILLVLLHSQTETCGEDITKVLFGHEIVAV